MWINHLNFKDFVQRQWNSYHFTGLLLELAKIEGRFKSLEHECFWWCSCYVARNRNDKKSRISFLNKNPWFKLKYIRNGLSLQFGVVKSQLNGKEENCFAKKKKKGKGKETSQQINNHVLFPNLTWLLLFDH